MLNVAKLLEDIIRKKEEKPRPLKSPNIPVLTPDSTEGVTTRGGETSMRGNPPSANRLEIPKLTLANPEKNPNPEPAGVEWSKENELDYQKAKMSNPDHPDNKVNPWRAAAALGLQNFGNALLKSGDWGTAIGQGLAGAGEGAVNPKILADIQTQKRIDELTPAVEAEIAQRKQADAERVRLLDEANKTATYQGKVIDNEKGKLDYSRAGLELLRLKNKPLYDSITADGQVTAEEAQTLTESGYPVQPYDARKFDIRYENGVPYSAPDKGLPDFKPLGNLPVRQREKEVEYTSPSGNKFALNQNQAAQMESAILQGDANRAMQVTIANNRTANENIETENKAKNEREQFLATRDGYMTAFDMANAMIPQIEQELQTLRSSNAETALITQKESQLQNAIKSRNEALAKAKESEQKYNRYQTPKAQQPIDKNSVPRLNRVPKATEQEIVDRLRKRGASQQQIQTAIQKAKEDGVI